jgi:restriction system protein
MSRKRATKSTFDEALDAFVRLPVKVGLIVAVGLFVLGWALPVIFSGESGFAALYAQGGRSILWLLAAIVAVAAVIGAAGRLIDRDRLNSTREIDDLTWTEFEAYLAEYFRRRGAAVTNRGGALADGGVDLVLDDASGRRIVQAKHWKGRRVGVVPLRALWGILDDERAQGAIVVTSGEFTPDALEFAEGKRLELIGRDQLERLIAGVKGSGVPVAATPEAAPRPCPQCSRGVLQKRLARRGQNAGSYFLGCSRFPDCRYTASLP